MGEISLPVLVHTVIFLAFPLVGGYLALRMKLPPIIGYILGGIALAAYLGEQLSEEFLSHIASIGIILLLFAVGLEARLSTLQRFGKFVIWGGLLQLAFTSVLIFILSSIFGFAVIESVFIAAAFALSSTAVVAKIIQDKGEEDSLIGGLSVGILVLQDLAVIPIIIIFSSLKEYDSGNINLLITLFWSLFRAFFVLGLVYVLGKIFVPVIFNKITKRSRELLNLFTIFFIFAVVFLFSSIGLSASIAAFIAGVLVGQTMQHYHIFSQIRPMRDIFAILFFAYLGANINIFAVFPQIIPILFFAVFVVIIKFLVLLIIFILLKFHSRTAFSLSVLLSQVGEFAFIILFIGKSQALVSEQVYLFAITASLLTIAVTPILIAKKDSMYKSINDYIFKKAPQLSHFIRTKFDRHPPHITALNLKNHVILCGFGTVGSYIGRALQMANIDFIAIDYDFYKVEQAKARGINIIYGDPTNIDILDYVECEKAAAIISAVPEKYAQEMIILNAKRLKRNITVFTRITMEGDQQRMKDLGAHVVIQPQFEAALAIVKKILLDFGVARDEILGKIKRLKIEHGMA